MSSKISIELANKRLEQAEEFYNTALLLYDNKSYRSANNRAYYSIFYSIKTVLSLEPKDFRRHKDILAYFNQHYVNENVFPKSVGKEIAKASLIRDNSDYNEFYIVSKEDTEKVIKTSKKLYDYVKKYMENWISKNVNIWKFILLGGIMKEYKNIDFRLIVSFYFFNFFKPFTTYVTNIVTKVLLKP